MAQMKDTGGFGISPVLPKIAQPPQPNITPKKTTEYYSPPRIEPFQLSLQQWQNALPDVNPNTIASLYGRGVRVNRIPNAPNPYTTNTFNPFAPAPQIYYSGNQLGGRGANGSVGALGHETVHAWGRYSMNPLAVHNRNVEFLQAVGSLAGKPYTEDYTSPFRQEGHASMYWAPSDMESTYKKTPEWFRTLALAGYLQPAPVIPGWGTRVMNAPRR